MRFGSGGRVEAVAEGLELEDEDVHPPGVVALICISGRMAAPSYIG